MRVVLVEDIMMEGMASIQRKGPISRKQKANHSPSFILGADRQLSCHVRRSSTPKQLQEKASDTLFRSVTDYPSFRAVY
ncbi:hypothetical protein TNCV_2355891 [Trichonephila clavipes]|nr:hypothetical protein TNCV_2355891 [Trichonephila clavipes]